MGYARQPERPGTRRGLVLLYSPHAEFGSPGSSQLEQSQSFMLLTNGLFHLTSAPLAL